MIDDRMRGEGRDEKRVPPKPGYPLETPFFEDEFDPYVWPHPTADPLSSSEEVEDDSDDFYRRDPEYYWLEEGMWPWPEPPTRRDRMPGPPGV